MQRLVLQAVIASWLALLLGCTPAVRSAQDPTPAAIEAIRQLQVIQDEWDKAFRAYQAALSAAKSDAEFQRLSTEKRPDPKPYAARFLKLAEAYPKTYAEAAALYWVIGHAQGTEYARKALPQFKNGPVATANLGLLWGLLFFGNVPRAASIREVTPLVYDRVVKELDHPKAPDLLIWVCQATATNDRSPEGTRLHRKAADLLVSRFAQAKYLWRFCPLLEHAADSAWAEKHLRTVLQKNKVPAVKVGAAFALASVLQNKAADSQALAENLYRQVIKEAGPAGKQWSKTEQENSFRQRESFHHFSDTDDLVRRAQRQLDEMKTRGVGKTAPEIAGEDLDGKPIRLSDYRGKVVLISFWATWCAPCMALVPHERQLTRRLDGKPFVLLGVNGDDDLPKARKVATAQGMTWRSFKDKRPEGDAISTAWKLEGWPTLYLIDPKGIIRKRWVGAPPGDVLDREIERLVSAVEKGTDR